MYIIKSRLGFSLYSKYLAWSTCKKKKKKAWYKSPMTVFKVFYDIFEFIIRDIRIPSNSTQIKFINSSFNCPSRNTIKFLVIYDTLAFRAFHCQQERVSSQSQLYWAEEMEHNQHFHAEFLEIGPLNFPERI